LPRASSVTLPREPPRRRRSRETSRVSRERQLPVHPDQRADQDEQPHEGADALAGLGDHEPLDRGDVGRQAGEGVAEAAAVVRGGGERQHVGEDVAAQVDEEALGDVRREVVVGPRHDAAGDVEADVEQRQHEERLEGGRDEDVVDEALVEHRLHDGDQRRRGEEQQAEHQPAAQRSEPRPEAPRDVDQPQRRGHVDEGRLLGDRAEGTREATAYGHQGSSAGAAGQGSGTGGTGGTGGRDGRDGWAAPGSGRPPVVVGPQVRLDVGSAGARARAAAVAAAPTTPAAAPVVTGGVASASLDGRREGGEDSGAGHDALLRFRYPGLPG
jgi:hypothetical protein